MTGGGTTKSAAHRAAGLAVDGEMIENGMIAAIGDVKWDAA